MIVHGRRERWRVAVAALYALAMLLVGFAHVPLATGAERGPDLSAYALPDGTLPVFCATEGTGTDQPAARHGPQMCDACLVTAAPGLVPPHMALPAPPQAGARCAALPRRATRARAVWNVPQARGPPAGRLALLSPRGT